MEITLESAKVNRRITSENMIIAGIVVNALFSSILMFFVSNSFSPKVHSVIWWLLGNLQVYKISNVVIPGIILLVGLLETCFNTLTEVPPRNIDDGAKIILGLLIFDFEGIGLML